MRPEDASDSSEMVDVNALLKILLVSNYSAISEQVADELSSEAGAEAVATGATLTLEDGKLVVRIDADQLRDHPQQFSSDKQQPVSNSASGFEIVMYLPLQQPLEPEVAAVSGESVDSPLPQVTAEKVMTAVDGEEDTFVHWIDIKC